MYPYYVDITDPEVGSIAYIEVEVEVSVTVSHGDAVMVVEDVSIGGVSLLNAKSPLTRAMGEYIRDKAQGEVEAGGDLWSDVCEREEIGHRYRDPEGPSAYYA